MPPADQSPQSTIRYLTQIIAVLARKAGGSLRIKQSALRKIREESFRLVEDFDDRNDEIVLRFDAKHLWIMAIEAEACQPSAPKSVPLPAALPARPASATVPLPLQLPPKPNGQTLPQTGSFLPYTDEQLARAERRILQEKMLRSIRKERSPTG